MREKRAGEGSDNKSGLDRTGEQGLLERREAPLRLDDAERSGRGKPGCHGCHLGYQENCQRDAFALRSAGGEGSYRHITWLFSAWGKRQLTSGETPRRREWSRQVSDNRKAHEIRRGSSLARGTCHGSCARLRGCGLSRKADRRWASPSFLPPQEHHRGLLPCPSRRSLSSSVMSRHRRPLGSWWASGRCCVRQRLCRKRACPRSDPNRTRWSASIPARSEGRWSGYPRER